MLKTKRLQIVPVTLDALKAYKTKEYPIDKNMSPHISWSLEMSESDPSFLGWGVWIVIENNKIIGDIGFKGKPNADHVVEIGYGVLPHVQNNGYGTEAVKALCHWAFETGIVKKIVANCIADNQPSIKVLEKLSMKQVGSKDNLLLWELVK